MGRTSVTLRKSLKKLQLASLLTVTALSLSTMAFQPKVAAAVSLGGPFNCDANSVIWCGASHTSTIRNDYTHGDGHNSAKSIQTIYSHFGISQADINNLDATAVVGSVTKSGDVYVGRTLVATNAWTAGRDNIAGSTKVTINGVTFYERKPSVSFLNNSLTAYVVMQNGQFKFALLSACGNPIKATPKPPTKSSLACTQLFTTPGTVENSGDQSYAFTAKATASNASISSYVFSLGTGHGSQTVKTTATTASSSKQMYAPGTYAVSVRVNGVAKNIFTSAPSSATCMAHFTVKQPKQPTCTAPNGQVYPKGSQNCVVCQYNSKVSANSSACVPPKTPTPPVTPTATVLPNTGAGNVVGIFLGATVLGTFGYHLVSRRRLARR